MYQLILQFRNRFTHPLSNKLFGKEYAISDLLLILLKCLKYDERDIIDKCASIWLQKYGIKSLLYVIQTHHTFIYYQ